MAFDFRCCKYVLVHRLLAWWRCVFFHPNLREKLTYQIQMQALVWRNWIGDDKGCQTITIPHVLFYFFEKQSMNHFLYDRAKIVHESLQLEALRLKYLKILRLILWLVVVIGVPIFFYWSAFVAFTGFVAPEKNCVFFVIFEKKSKSFLYDQPSASGQLFWQIGILPSSIQL